MHDLHRKTKFASPLLPDISLVSLEMSGLRKLAILRGGSNMATDADPIWVDLSAIGALDFEHVEERFFLRVDWRKVCDTVGVSIVV